MLPVRTTVVTVIAPDQPQLLEHVHAANIRVLRTDPETSLLERATAAWEQARSTPRTYLVHDADPLAVVADAYVRYFDGSAVTGDLELAVAETLSRWRARSLDLPDYYLVYEPEDLPPTLRHWFFGVLATAAPARVTAFGRAEPLTTKLTQLRSGLWWPQLDILLDHLDQVVPDQIGRLATEPADDAAPSRPLIVGH